VVEVASKKRDKPRCIFSASDVVEELALEIAEPFCTLTPDTEAIEEVADTIVCKSAWSYSLKPYNPEP